MSRCADEQVFLSVPLTTPQAYHHRFPRSAELIVSYEEFSN